MISRKLGVYRRYTSFASVKSCVSTWLKGNARDSTRPDSREIPITPSIIKVLPHRHRKSWRKARAFPIDGASGQRKLRVKATLSELVGVLPVIDLPIFRRRGALRLFENSIYKTISRNFPQFIRRA